MVPGRRLTRENAAGHRLGRGGGVAHGQLAEFANAQAVQPHHAGSNPALPLIPTHAEHHEFLPKEERRYLGTTEQLANQGLERLSTLNAGVQRPGSGCIGCALQRGADQLVELTVELASQTDPLNAEDQSICA